MPINSEPASTFRAIILAGGAILISLIGLSFIASQFAPDTFDVQRPVLEMLALYGIAFSFYLFACKKIWDELQQRQTKTVKRKTRNCFTSIILLGLLFRCLIVFSPPILEVDIYRYLWDGYVTVQTGDPYNFAPLEIAQASYPPEYQRPFARSPEELKTIAGLAEKANTAGYDPILRKVHFAEYTSPYPPVSQAVFALAAWITPQGSSPHWHLVIMKSLLLVFDLLTAIVVVLILRHAGLPDELVIAYWWCPLLIKEIANSGHLDAIAVFFSALFGLFAVYSLWRKLPDGRNVSPHGSVGLSCVAAFVLAMAVGAKIYPAVLGPVWFFMMTKRLKLKAVVPLSVFCLAVFVINWPMLRYVVQPNEPVAMSIQEVSFDATKPVPGITAFAKSWEMNDLLFMLAVENIKPPRNAGNAEPVKPPWFVLTSSQLRTGLSDWRLGTRSERQKLAIPGDPVTIEFESAFRFTRILLLGTLSIVLLWLSKRAWQLDSPAAFAQMAFLSIAWFWLMSPTQNPWYWCWALPFLPFVKNRVWFLFAGVAIAYYLRFFFEYHFHFSQGPVAGTPYYGTQFFDYVVPFVEFGPLLLLLFYTRFWPRRRSQE
jgi:hypothetical protein